MNFTTWHLHQKHVPPPHIQAHIYNEQAIVYKAPNTNLHMLSSLGGGDLLTGEGWYEVLVLLRLLPVVIIGNVSKKIPANQWMPLHKLSRSVQREIAQKKLQTQLQMQKEVEDNKKMAEVRLYAENWRAEERLQLEVCRESVTKRERQEKKIANLLTD